MLAPLADRSIASVFTPQTRIEADGTVEGYASLFGEIDQARDMVVRGIRRHAESAWPTPRTDAVPA